MRIPLVAILILLAASAHAGPRSSTDYSIPAEVVDAGGKASASTSYSNQASIGGSIGVPHAAAPDGAAIKAGYIPRISRPVHVQLYGANQQRVDELATIQLGALHVLEDVTWNELPASALTWSVLNGPISGVDANGLATAAAVYQTDAANIQGVYQGRISTLGLSIYETIPDNYGSYSGDGLGDDWQMQYFGPASALAGPGVDADGDGQSNLFEYEAGLIPTNPLSRFLLRIEPVAGQPLQKRLVFSPVLAGRSYTVEHLGSLAAGPWTALTGGIAADSGDERSVIDPAASAARRFYRVKVQKP